MTEARANAKINLALKVRAPRNDGYHPLRGLSQSIDWFDEISVADAEADAVVVSNDMAPADEDNLAWIAVDNVRRAAGSSQPMQVAVHKSIPDGAGLGGGSADAGAALILASRRFGVSFDEVRRLAVDLGADVPFALVGGTAVVTGIGEFVSPQPDAAGFALAVVVPPFRLETSLVFAAWDDLGGPEGPALPASALPPVLRDHAPVTNDLYPAAVAVVAALDDWRAELEGAWGIPVAMTGSGSALYGYFPSIGEAEDAVGEAPPEARAARAASPASFAWQLIDEQGP
ncbi:MAG: 4-(cytidine 5'-diphospho)-2-C-methyl-D-erythritol kinase [Acidimicrobiia bacterium]|nr:MAG: 4-(cytidine 5'-diphospho)-2-C-methyl-D-erythritol kinase [Acidimicrobiia bacterium]